jgi:hypothetical protein
MAALPVFAIGHSTRPIDEVAGLLRSHEVSRVIDVRTRRGHERDVSASVNAVVAAVDGERDTCARALHDVVELAH